MNEDGRWEENDVADGGVVSGGSLHTGMSCRIAMPGEGMFEVRLD